MIDKVSCVYSYNNYKLLLSLPIVPLCASKKERQKPKVQYLFNPFSYSTTIPPKKSSEPKLEENVTQWYGF